MNLQAFTDTKRPVDSLNSETLEGQKARKTCFYNWKDYILDRYLFISLFPTKGFFFFFFFYNVTSLGFLSSSSSVSGRVRCGARPCKTRLGPFSFIFSRGSMLVMKDLTQEFEVHSGVGWGGGAERLPNPSFRLPLLAGLQWLSFLKSWVSAAVPQWIHLPLQGNGFCFFLGLGVC